jgi:putative ABC transport system permease protein
VGKVALRGLLTRKLRSGLTGFAVVVGVAFVVGTLVFTDSIDASFKNLFERVQKGVDVSVEAHQAVKASFQPPPTMPASALDAVKAAPGVDVAEGAVSFDSATLLDDKGKPIKSNGPPTNIVSTFSDTRFDPLEYESGGAPKTADEVAIDRGTSKKFHFRVGDTVTVQGDAPAKRYKVAGVATLGGRDSLGGSRMIVMTLPEAHRVTGHAGYDSISVATGDPEGVKAALKRALGRGYDVRTGKEAAAQQAHDLSSDLGFLRTALLVFAGVSLIVGGFLIFNTFAVTVAQRTREFALLRVLGASRAQLLRSVLIETLVIGLVASILGVLAGIALAPGLAAMLKAFGLDLGTTGLVVSPGTVIAGMLVGLIATMVSGFIPARRATRVEPVTAMRESVTPGAGRIGRRRVAGALALEAAGVLALFVGLFGGTGSSNGDASLLGLGALLMVFGLALIAPVLVRPLARVIGAPLARTQGLTGVLARENAIRQPQRTAVTAAALMVGLALVVLVTIFAAGLKGSVSNVIDKQVDAKLVVQNQDGFSRIPADVVDRVRNLPGVATASAVRLEPAVVRGESGTIYANGVDPATVGSVMKLKWRQGSARTLSSLGDDQVLLDVEWAKTHQLAVGGTLHLTTPPGKQVDYRVAGTFKNQAGLTGPVIVTGASMQRDWAAKQIQYLWATADPGAKPEQLAKQAGAALKAFPATEALTIDQFKKKQQQGLDTIVNLVFALLLLSVLIALLGIVNTLALSVHERTRELGMLRAVGMSRRQVRRMVRAESVITAVIGAVLGTLLGIAFAVIVSRPLADQGFVFVVPVGSLIAFFILAAIAGVLAAISPARRAAKVDVLRAVTTE